MDIAELSEEWKLLTDAASLTKDESRFAYRRRFAYGYLSTAKDVKSAKEKY